MEKTNEWEELWKPYQINIIKYFNFFIPASHYNFYWIWKQYKYFLKKINLNKDSNVIEIGCGKGLMNLKILKVYKSNITQLDNSSNALKLSKIAIDKIFGFNNNQKNKIIFKQENLFHHKNKKYDLVHSQGLIEHFENINNIIKQHFRLTKDEGYVFMIAPRNSISYRFARKIIELVTGKWPYGYEVPINPKEVKEIVKQYGEVIAEKNFIFAYGILIRKYRKGE